MDFSVRACFVGELEDAETFAVVLRDHLNEPQEWLEIQRPLFADQQDKQLGMDTYCLTRSSGATHYGGVSVCILERNILTLHLNDDAAAALVTSQVLLRLDLADVAFAELQKGLITIFAQRLPDSFSIA
ncbi:Imm10 family immunity protein [Deinococcus arenicola]|uniref:Imm10 family immunity protein n=1 Tax=Deinococcus arenicola TaxID=2994950 RepID=A0ABU4DKY1_9DEIO|nr:Imm10 family immunity protein [Deinococcus sp. ZS9-10]MDV6373076.1 Imm10 family immunity protein [Deinococcus sp. ZS9-10]